jgi:hypothetical protein
METVNKNFRLYKMIEIGFIGIGVVGVVLWSAHDFWLGIALGMLVQGALMLPADLLAEKRALHYLEQVRLVTAP